MSAQRKGGGPPPNPPKSTVDEQGSFKPSRRSFLTGSAVGAASVAATGLLAREAAAQSENVARADGLLDVTFRLNGENVTIAVDPRATLLDYLREDAGLTGTKVGCRHGQCGACTVHVGGEPHLSCLTLAAQAQDQDVTTIEGLADVARRDGYATEDGLHPLQKAFIEHDAFQCGYCTPGQIMSGAAAILEGHATNGPEVREYMSGNLCRCAAYPNIATAMLDARERMETAGVEIAAGAGARANYHLGLIERAGEANEPFDPTASGEASR